ncbi:MAG: hypothetical protein M1820_002887 [Bogoriella megaspora]|nr:MAG: hypothetical protein M1820_002887 [Bogoriella megaspora]
MAVGLDGLIQCLSCAQFFHVQCHLPIPQAGSGFLVKGRWYCAMCVRDGRDKKYQQPVRAADAQSKDQNYQTRDYSNDFDIDPAVLAERFEPKTRPYRIPRDSNGNPRLNSVDDPYSFDPVIDEKGKGSIRQPLTGFNGEPSDRLFSSLQTRREKKSKDQAFINFIRSKRSPEDQDTPTKSIEGAPSSFGLNRHTDLCNTKETGNEEGDIQRAIKPSLQNLGSSEANIKDEKELCTWVDRAVMNVYGKTPENMDLDNDDLDIRDFDDDNLDDTPEYMLMSDYDDLDDIDEEMMRSDDDLAIQEAIQRSLAKSDNSEPSFYSSTGKTEDIKRIGASPTKESKDKKKTRIHIKVPTAEKRKRSPTD